MLSIAGMCNVIKSALENISSIESAGSTWLGNFHAASTDKAGSYPTTFMSKVTPIPATFEPMEPKPTTPRVEPDNSLPLNFFLFSSRNGSSSSISSMCFKLFTKSILEKTLREESIKPANTSSFTALALAPGVLKTTMPLSVHKSTGILLTPTPALEIAFKDLFKLLLFNLVLLTKTPSGSLNSSSKTHSVLDKASKPIGEILLKVLILCSDIFC